MPGVRVADNLVERRFRPEAPDVLWVADITYLRIWEGWVYLAAVRNAYSRRIVGWSMTQHMPAELVVDALEMARTAAGRAHHSGQLVSSAFGQKRATPASRSRWAPRAAPLTTPSSRALRDAQETARPPALLADAARELINEVFEFAEGFYNITRRHSTLGYLSPAQFETMTTTNIDKDNG